MATRSDHLSTIPSADRRKNPIAVAIFNLKVKLLQARRFASNVTNVTRKHNPNSDALVSAPVLGSSETDLWYEGTSETDRLLTLGKIENLRVAVRAINGIEIPANEHFSFWKQIGHPTLAKGYRIGREIQEGCLVPTVAGGLCQLSNALYDAALHAGLTIIERHKHSQVIAGSLAEKGRDATVKWNYLDLRFSFSSAFRIEAELTERSLIVRVRSQEFATQHQQPKEIALPVQLGDCYACGDTACAKHSPIIPISRGKRNKTIIVDEYWPEYQQYLKTIADSEDQLILPFHHHDRFSIKRLAWGIDTGHIERYRAIAIKRSLQMRLNVKTNGNRTRTLLEADEEIVRSIATRISVESEHLIIAQNLLPYAQKYGLLGGRTFDVLMTRLPMEHLHQRLDHLSALYPESTTATDFRADQHLMDNETLALTRARSIITPHREIASIFQNKAVFLDWTIPAPKGISDRTEIVFPASALARKGAFEVKRLSMELGLPLTVGGNASEYPEFWKGVNVRHAAGNILEHAKLVIYPAVVEPQPRLLLRALSEKIPVIATDACGLSEHPLLTIIPANDYTALAEAVKNVL